MRSRQGIHQLTASTRDMNERVGADGELSVYAVGSTPAVTVGVRAQAKELRVSGLKMAHG